MKNNRLKKAVLALSLAATMAIPAAASFATPVTASAATPFISDTDYNGAINIDESQIDVTCKRYYPGGMGIQTNVSGTTVKTAGTVTHIPVLTRSVISLWVSGNGLTKAKAENVQLTVTYHINGKKNTATYKNPKVRPNTGTNSFILDFDVIVRGDSFEFSTTSISGVSNFRCTGSTISPQSGSGNYYQIEAKTPGGENLFISTRYPGNYSTNMEKWAKRLCMLANSLSDMTGVKLGTIYIAMDDPDNGGAYSANWYINDQENLYGYIAVNKDLSDVEINHAATGRNEITWTLMHEMAHSYAIGCTPTRFNSNYGFYRYQAGFYLDEYLTNVRALTAIQHCDNLRDVDVHFQDGNKMFYEKYNDIFNKINHPVSDPCFYHATKLAAIGNTYGWDKLEQYYKAASDNSYSSTENKQMAQKLKDYVGTSAKNLNVNDTDYLKYVNSFRKLMKLCWGYCNEQGFSSFVDQHFGKQCIINTLSALKMI